MGQYILCLSSSASMPKWVAPRQSRCFRGPMVIFSEFSRSDTQIESRQNTISTHGMIYAASDLNCRPPTMGMSNCKECLALFKAKIQKCFDAIQDFFALFRLMVDRHPQSDVECWAVMSWQFGVLRISFVSKNFKPTPNPF